MNTCKWRDLAFVHCTGLRKEISKEVRPLNNICICICMYIYVRAELRIEFGPFSLGWGMVTVIKVILNLQGLVIPTLILQGIRFYCATLLIYVCTLATKTAFSWLLNLKRSNTL